MAWNKQKTNPVLVERLVAGFCYCSAGLIGLLYIILTRSSGQSMFFRFHFMQSMMLAVVGFLLQLTVQITSNLLGGILGLFNNPDLAAHIISGLVTGVGWIVNAGMVLLLYGMVWAFMGKYAEIPVISPLVRQNMR